MSKIGDSRLYNGVQTTDTIVPSWLFYSAVNSVTPQIVLNLGFENNSWSISIRQLAYSVTTLVASIPIT